MFAIDEPEPLITFGELEIRYKIFCQYVKELLPGKVPARGDGVFHSLRLKVNRGRILAQESDE